MLFNAHDDVWTNITRKRQLGRKDILRNYHFEQYRKGGVSGGIFVIWQDEECGVSPKNSAYNIIKGMAIEAVECQDLVQIIRRKEDFEKAEKEGKLAVVIGVEGLNFIGGDLDLLYVLYMLGVRHSTLTWNEENALATGVNGNPQRGLTELGKQCVHKMNKMGMVIDVSHANEKTFWDICEVSSSPIIASHSNCRELCDVPRNLYDEQLKAIAETNGVVGLNAYSEFIHMDEKERTLERLAEHIDHMVEVMGIDHVGFGFDFVGYLHDETADNSARDDAPLIKDFEDITKAQNLVTLLSKKGYSSEDIEKIKYKNFVRVFNECMIK